MNASVLRLSLQFPPSDALIAPHLVRSSPAAWKVREFRFPDDLPGWLLLQQAAFAEQKPAGRSWTPERFWKEMGEKSHELAGNSWAVERSDNPHNAVDPVSPSLAGSLFLMFSTDKSGAVHPALHWLMVAPVCRRQGIATALLQKAVARVRQLGYARLHAETHTGWRDALAFYRAHGFY